MKILHNFLQGTYNHILRNINATNLVNFLYLELNFFILISFNTKKVKILKKSEFFFFNFQSFNCLKDLKQLKIHPILTPQLILSIQKLLESNK